VRLIVIMVVLIQGEGGARQPRFTQHTRQQREPPHTDPASPYNRKCAFDAGDYGLGFAANSLARGCDCVGEAHFWDGVVNDSAGAPVVIKNAVCLHEEDAGLLWKHLDYRTGYAEVRRARRLVVSMIMTAVNYEYCFCAFAAGGGGGTERGMFKRRGFGPKLLFWLRNAAFCLLFCPRN
jgi:Cu2+-containing amine oxidase